MSGVVRVEWPARLICSMVFLLGLSPSRRRVCARRVVDAAELVGAHLDGELAEHRRRAADDDIAGFYGANAFRRAGIDEIARIKRVERGGEFDQPAAIVNELVGV